MTKRKNGYLTSENKAALKALVNGGAEYNGQIYEEAMQVLSFDGQIDYTPFELNISATEVLKNAIILQGT